MSNDLLMRAIAWRNGEKTGRSSVALVSHLMGWPNGGKDFPRDGGDFGRCENALAEIGLRDQIEKARTLSLQWNALVENWSELEELYRRDRHTELYERISALVYVYCRRGCGELEWKSEREAVCPSCSAQVFMRDPRLPKPAPEKPKGVRGHLVVRYLLVDATGAIVDAEPDCDECGGDGEVECSSCGHEHDCEACDGAGRVKVTASPVDEPPIAGEGEEVIVAIMDDRLPKGPRIAYPSIEDANHALQALLDLPDETLSSFFAERRAA